MVAAINEVNTVQASAGAAYGESCQMYEAKADKKLANSDMICLAGYGCGLKVEHNALIVRQGYSHEGQKPTTTILHRGVQSGSPALCVLGTTIFLATIKSDIAPTRDRGQPLRSGRAAWGRCEIRPANRPACRVANQRR